MDGALARPGHLNGPSGSPFCNLLENPRMISTEEKGPEGGEHNICLQQHEALSARCTYSSAKSAAATVGGRSVFKNVRQPIPKGAWLAAFGWLLTIRVTEN
jgi:hypothetical protein